MRISPCTEADLAPLNRYLPTGRDDVHAHHLGRHQSGEADYLIAWHDVIPVGNAVITWAGHREQAARAALPNCPAIGFLHVDRAHRGTGIGSALIAAAEERIVARGYRRAGMAVGIDNPRAASLYERLGYRDTSVRCESRYTWFDESGVGHDVVEWNLYLVKDLPPFTAPD